MIKAVTIRGNHVSLSDKYIIYTNKKLLGSLVRCVRGNMYVTLFFESDDAMLFCLKYDYIDVISIDYVPDAALTRQIRVSAEGHIWFENTF